MLYQRILWKPSVIGVITNSMKHQKSLKPNIDSRIDRDDYRKLLAQARKIGSFEIHRRALDILSEATIIMRWKKPFYVA
jgi:hypothetical protein